MAENKKAPRALKENFREFSSMGSDKADALKQQAQALLRENAQFLTKAVENDETIELKKPVESGFFTRGWAKLREAYAAARNTMTPPINVPTHTIQESKPPKTFDPSKHVRISQHFIDHLKNISNSLSFEKNTPTPKPGSPDFHTSFEIWEKEKIARAPIKIAQKGLEKIIRQMELLKKRDGFVSIELINKGLVLPLQTEGVSAEQRFIAELYINGGKVEIGENYFNRVKTTFDAQKDVPKEALSSKDNHSAPNWDVEQRWDGVIAARLNEVRQQIERAIRLGFIKSGESKFVSAPVGLVVQNIQSDVDLEGIKNAEIWAYRPTNNEEELITRDKLPEWAKAYETEGLQGLTHAASDLESRNPSPQKFEKPLELAIPKTSPDKDAPAMENKDPLQ